MHALGFFHTSSRYDRDSYVIVRYENIRKGCYRAFGMETFHIPDSQITASSYKKYHEPAQARLHMGASASGNGAWCASQSYQQGEWLQVDLGGKKTVTGIATQGKLDYFVNAWTTHLVVLGSFDQANWYQAFGGKTLICNFDTNSVQYNEAPVPFIARYLRFEPKQWYNEICLRVEIDGCDG